MHAANRAAWDEAAERYEGWFDEAVELIRSGGSNLFPVEHELLGDLRRAALARPGDPPPVRRWPRHAVALEPRARDEVVGVDISPRMLDLARRG